jgi:outer membrane protein OmpA-like peptidoglycan-associated protein
MRNSISVVVALVASAPLSACATKGYVQQHVKSVNDKVETLSASVEDTQERTRRNEGAIGQVDQKAGAAQTSATRAQQAADGAGAAANSAAGQATAANARAEAVGTRVEEVDKNARRLVFEVVLSDAEGNFKSGDTKLPDEAKAKLDELVAQLKADPKGAFFEIEGHTDSVGPKKLNEQLGLERAEVVKRYLYEQHQIPLHKMNVISYGPERPAAPNTSKEGRAQNRRVVIKVLV